MIVKLIPETKSEKESFQETTHRDVKEFFLFGTKKEMDGDFIDFHDWHGGYRYLLGSLQYFYEIVNEKRRIDDARRMMPQNLRMQPPAQNNSNNASSVVKMPSNEELEKIVADVQANKDQTVVQFKSPHAVEDNGTLDEE